VYGSNGGAGFRNVKGSFFDFVAESYHGRNRQTLAEPPDAWGSRAIVHWVHQLQQSPSYDPEIESLIEVAAVLDQIYGRNDTLGSPGSAPARTFKTLELPGQHPAKKFTAPSLP
jgi:hypothetical protein